MQLEPYIKLKLKEFKNKNEINELEDSVAFEKLVNQTILLMHQPDAFNVETDLIDYISVGGSNDMGIDGIAIKFNGIFVKNKDEIYDLMRPNTKDRVEFLFIQSKYKRSFDSKEYSVFVSGVQDFLQTDQYQPCNEKVKLWIELKEYILSDDVMIRWDANPTIRLYYVVMGEWNQNDHIIAKSKQFENNILSLRTYEDIYFSYIDSRAFKNMYEEAENNFDEVLNILDTFSLTEVSDVENSCIALCHANEFMKLLTTREGILRKSLFVNNVRDFQGDTPVNGEMYETISADPSSFVLLNNGITIVCNELKHGNRKITVGNPQIVNGCQTSSVLYNAYKNGIRLEDIVITIKFIATKSNDVTNKIVRGTNKQNIVLDEVFEITREFHKELEEFIISMSSMLESDFKRIYYERRSKQYSDNFTIKPTQKVNLKVITQDFVSIFLLAPHHGHRHEAKLLDLYKNQIFVDGQSKYPYYLTVLLHVLVQKLFRCGFVNKSFKTYKSHILLISVLLMNGPIPDINKERKIDKYCSEVIEILKVKGEFKRYYLEAVGLFKVISGKWVQEKGENYKYSIKESPEFTKYLIGEVINKADSIWRDNDLYNRGRVKEIRVDRYGYKYGFISRVPFDIFFHSEKNKHLDFDMLEGKDVIYVEEKSENGKIVAIQVQVIN